ncbi:hypothetical protein [Paraburkholderia sp. HP33-1]|nr:hypothetical protein [Paraburkholderia sp. HP33-1]
MKRFFAIALFVAGGFATELAHPLQCSFIQASGVQLKRRNR